MPTFIATNGEDFVVQQQDRAFKGGLVEAFKVNGLTGVVSSGGKTVATGSVFSLVHAGKNGTGAVAIAGALAGDVLIAAANITTPGDVQSSFETTTTVNAEIQQTSASDLSVQQILFVFHRP